MKQARNRDTRPGMEILRGMLDAPADDPVCSVDGVTSPAEAVADIISKTCPPGHEAAGLCLDRAELGGGTCRDCWLAYLLEGA